MSRRCIAFLAGIFPLIALAQQTPSLGLFEEQADVGQVIHPGTASYDAATKTYTLSGSGENMWFAKDEFHFVWRKVSAKDLSLGADISMLGDGGDAHRKAVLMIRQNLETDAAYVDAARHGEGLTSLQYREHKGSVTREIESNVSGPARLRIEKQGDRFYMWVGPENGELQFSGGSARVAMQAPFYVGIGVCAHNKDAIEQASFRKVELATVLNHRRASYSTIETMLVSGDARAGYVSTEHLGTPGWSPDGKSLTYRSRGKTGEAPFTPLRTAAPVGAAIVRSSPAGRDLYTSPDGKYVLLSSRVGGTGEVTLKLMTAATKTIKNLATFAGGKKSLGSDPWSPDGRRLVFVSYQKMK